MIVKIDGETYFGPIKFIRISLYSLAFVIFFIITFLCVQHSEATSKKELKDARTELNDIQATSGVEPFMKEDYLKIIARLIIRCELDSANVVLQKSLIEYKHSKGPCCDHFCLSDSTQKRKKR